MLPLATGYTGGTGFTGATGFTGTTGDAHEELPSATSLACHFALLTVYGDIPFFRVLPVVNQANFGIR